VVKCSLFLDQRKEAKMKWLLDPHIGDRKGVYRGVVGRCNGKRALGRIRSRWKGSEELQLRDVDWTDLALDRDMWWAVLW
jgi:hypothetical protein